MTQPASAPLGQNRIAAFDDRAFGQVRLHGHLADGGGAAVADENLVVGRLIEAGRGGADPFDADGRLLLVGPGIAGREFGSAIRRRIEGQRGEFDDAVVVGRRRDRDRRRERNRGRREGAPSRAAASWAAVACWAAPTARPGWHSG